jgi:hypothetical protein
MRFKSGWLVLVFLLTTPLLAQDTSRSAPTTVTVPLALDQGRIVIDVDLPLPDDSTQRVRGWVDNGNPNLTMTQRIANLLGVKAVCTGQDCTAKPNPPAAALEVLIGGLKVSLPSTGDTKILATPSLAPGMSAEINLPSTALRNYDVLINFPDHEFTIALPGRLKFNGVKSKALIAGDGLIRIPSRIENKNYDLSLDLASSVNFVSAELFDKLSNAHPNWPHMTGAVGPFNTGELASEPDWKLMRVDRLQYGPLFLTDVAVTPFPANPTPVLEQRESAAAAGLLSSEALINYRVGLDYTHSAVYFDIGRTARFPDFDVVGLILRPGVETGFTVVGIADLDGQPSVDGVRVGDQLVAVNDVPVADSTIGQVWSLLQGTPGQERKLTLARSGKQFSVVARAKHFLGDTGNDSVRKKPEYR